MTKVIILGEEPKQEGKPIEFVKALKHTIDRPAFSNPAKQPKEWDNVELVSKGGSETYFDLIYAYNHIRCAGVLYLGHFNDGIV